MQRSRQWLIIIIFVAIALRVAAALYLGDHVVKLPGTFDQLSYDALAQRVLDGHGFSFATLWWPATRAGEPTAHWSFLYTLYLTAIYGLVGYHPLAARLIQAVLAGALMPWLVYRLGRRHFSAPASLIAAGLIAGYIYFIYYAAALMTETFYIIGILWTLDLAGQLGQAGEFPLRARRRSLLLGIALAVTVLLRQVFLLFIPVLFTWLLWRSYRQQDSPMGLRPGTPPAPSKGAERDRVSPSGGPGGPSTQAPLRMMGVLLTATVVLLLAIAPWTARNYRAFDRFVLLNTNAGFAFYWANHPIQGSNFISILPADGPSYVALIPPDLLVLNEAELDQALLKRGLGFIRADPGRYLLLSISRIKDYFKFWPSSGSSLISNMSRLLSFGLLWPLMAYGLIVSLRRTDLGKAFILYLFVITYTAIHLLSWALIRYRLPVDAVLLVFAGAALAELQVKLSQRQVRLPVKSTTATSRHRHTGEI